MTFKVDDRIFETSVTTGTGTYTLDGPVTGYQAFSEMTANNYCPYFVTMDNSASWESGIGQVLGSPARLARTHVIASSNSDAAVDWGAGTKNVRCGQIAPLAVPRRTSKSVAGSANVTLTQNEMRCDELVFTGALTGNIDVIVDDTVWKWASVFNNTSGAFTLTFKVTGQTGVNIPQASMTPIHSNGTDVTTSTVGQLRRRRVVTASETWAKPAGIKGLLVTVIGGGASGPSCQASASEVDTGAGGPSGGWSIKYLPASSLGATETLTVGAAGASPGTGAAANGNAGGTTSFGAHCSATGGAAPARSGTGTVVNPTAATASADPGVGASGDINVKGNYGWHGSRTNNTAGYGGHGGSTPWGGGGEGTVAGGGGGTGQGFGAGGGSACSDGTTIRAGGAGAPGAVLLEEFY